MGRIRCGIGIGLLAAFPVCAQIRTVVFDASGSTSITSMRLTSGGEIILAGVTANPSFPVANAYQSRLNGGILRRTSNGGRTWQLCLAPADAISELVVDPSEANTVYASTSNGLYRSTDAAQSWNLLANSVSGKLVLDPPSALYAGLNRSVDGGVTWTRFAFPGDGILSMAVDPFTHAIYIVSGDGVYRSTDGTRSWDKVRTPGTDPRLIQFDPRVPGLAYVYLQSLVDPGGAGWWRSADALATWAHLPHPTTPYLTVDPLHGGVLYAYEAGYAIKSENRGATWSGLTTLAGFGPIRIVPGTPPTLLYFDSVSYDGGTTWSRPSLGLDLADNAPFASASSVAGVAYATGEVEPDAFVTRLDPTGKLVRFSTYLGGTSTESMGAVAIDADDNLYVAGGTSSTDFPTTTGAASRDAGSGFVTKFDTSGNVLWSTRTPDAVVAIAVDQDRSAILLTRHGYAPGTLSRLSPGGDRLTTVASLDVLPDAMAMNAKGDIVVAGRTGLQYPTGYGRVAVVRFDPAGNVQSRTSFPENASSLVADIAFDPNDNAVLLGSTVSSSFPTTAGALQASLPGDCPFPPASVSYGLRASTGAFIARIAPSGAIVSSTLFGGQCNETALRLALAPNGDAILTGLATSPALPLVNAIEAGPSLGASKGFVARISPDATALLWSTFVGKPSIPAVPPSGPVVLSSTGELLFLTVPEPLPLAITAVGNAFHNNSAAVAAGEIAFVDVTGLDGVVARDLGLNGAPAVELSGVRVYFDDKPAGLMAVSSRRIYCRVPPDLSPGSAAVRVESSGAASNPLRVGIVKADPGLLALSGSGQGQANARNTDGTLNSPDHPAAPGSTIQLFFTGIASDPAQLSISTTPDTDLPCVVSAGPVDGFFPGLSQVVVVTPSHSSGDVPISLNGSPALTISIGPTSGSSSTNANSAEPNHR